jgi:DNA-binding transcriptional LysR family regulator
MLHSRVSLDLLRTFIVVGSSRTFAEAARELRVSVSAISQQIRALEGQLATPLFARVGRRAVITDAGRRLHQELLPELQRIDHAVTHAIADHHEVRGDVKLGAPRPFARHWLRPRFPGLLAAHPDLTLTVTFDVPSALEHALLDGTLDLAVLTRPADDPGVDSVALFVERFVCVASAAYLARAGRPRSEEEFRAHRFIVFDDDLPMHAPWWRATFGRRKVPASSVVCRVASLDEMQALARAGVGLCVLPSYLVDGDSALVVVDPRGSRPATSSIFLAWRRGSVDTARRVAVASALRA